MTCPASQVTSLLCPEFPVLTSLLMSYCSPIPGTRSGDLVGFGAAHSQWSAHGHPIRGKFALWVLVGGTCSPCLPPGLPPFPSLLPTLSSPWSASHTAPPKAIFVYAKFPYNLHWSQSNSASGLHCLPVGHGRKERAMDSHSGFVRGIQ